MTMLYMAPDAGPWVGAYAVQFPDIQQAAPSPWTITTYPAPTDEEKEQLRAKIGELEAKLAASKAKAKAWRRAHEALLDVLREQLDEVTQ